MSTKRKEADAMGEIEVPANKLWGAQTQRSLEHFDISCEKMPEPLIHALAIIKRASAITNHKLKLIDKQKAEAIIKAADEVISGQLAAHFPLSVWQTGSGTQTNMNINEVLANRASELLGGERGAVRLIHPNDDVNMSQSSNDVFPSAMHIASLQMIHQALLPGLQQLLTTLSKKSEEFAAIVKIGRTHLQDATPLTLGQEISGWVAMLAQHEQQLKVTVSRLLALALGGTAVGTGLNTDPRYADSVAQEIAEYCGQPYISADNKFAALAGCDALVQTHACLKGLATALFKIANDIRWLASGPRCGLGELLIPENEPGSSIMPGKVNPTQCEAMTMLCVQVMANDVAVGFAGASGNFELNVFRPLVIYNLLQSIRLLADGCVTFNKYCAKGIEPNRDQINKFVHQSLMLVTALSPHLGYDKSAKIAKLAYQQGLTLKQAALHLNYLSEQQFDQWVVPENMVRGAAS